MATKASVDFSKNGESNQENIATDQYISPNNYDFKPVQGKSMYKIFKLKDKKKKGSVSIDGIQENVFNPKTNKRERIWLIRGMDTIWQSELTEQLKDKDSIGRNRRHLKFERGILRVPDHDQYALEFLKHHHGNIDNPNRVVGANFEFEEYNPAKIQALALEREMKELDMVMEAQKQPVEKMKKHAHYLGIQANDELGVKKSDEGIRREYMLAAKRNPALFEKSLNSPEVEIAYLVRQAIIDSKIDVGGGIGGNIIWAGNGGFITKLPIGRKAHEYLVEFAMTNSQEGKSFKEQLSTIVN
jgi:hypothetical protein